MLVGRESELAYLQQFYEKIGNQLLIVYGHKNVGKTSLLLQFAQNYSYFYYLAQPCSESKQKLLWLKELSSTKEISTISSYTELLHQSIPVTKQKAVIIIDEFQLLTKSGNAFISSVVSFIKEHTERKVMIILASSSISWIENSMVSKIGTLAYAISGFYKVRELSFQSVWDLFPTYTEEDCLTLYSIVGGNPGLLSCMNQNVDMKTNIYNNMLEPNSILRIVGENILTDELRETAVYNTILETIAMGKDKLNDLFLSTGFSRAKISVYLKHLIELELVEKIFSYDTEGREHTKKGVYRIHNHYTYFWYKFIFPNVSKLEQLSTEIFFDTYIASYMKDYIAMWYKDICVEYLYQLDEKKQLPVSNLSKKSEWIGKEGIIDAILEDAEGHVISVFCKFDFALTTYEDYEWDIFCIKQAKLHTDYLYLFSFPGFEERVISETKTKNNIVLIPFRQMYSR